MIDTSDLDPELAGKIHELERLANLEGIFPTKTSGARGFALQSELYALWRTNPAEARRRGVVSQPSPPGLSRHHPIFGGLAGAIDLDAGPGPSSTDPRQARLTDLALSLGLVCGAGWGDPVHYELSGLYTRLFEFNQRAMAYIDAHLGALV